MTTYFGFIPSYELSTQIDDTLELLSNKTTESLHSVQLALTNQYAQEILENLVFTLVGSVEDEQRKIKLEKVSNMVRSTIELMNKQVIIEQPNDKIADGLNFLINTSLFIDNDRQQRIGFLLTGKETKIIRSKLAEAQYQIVQIYQSK